MGHRALYLLLQSESLEARTVTSPDVGGPFEVLRESDDLVVRNARGADVFRDVASRVTKLTIIGSDEADMVTVLDTGVAVDTPLVFRGGGGNDRFDASLAGGAVTLKGNGGRDTLIGGSDDDVLRGGSGKDELVGGSGDDFLNGGGSTGDTLEGGLGNDTLNGGRGNDVLRELNLETAVLANTTLSGRGSDVVIDVERARLSGHHIDASAFFAMGMTSVTIVGGSGDDTLIGSPGSDLIYGGDGRDSIEGGGGNDRLYGGQDGDTLIGGGGDDLLEGQSGSGDRLTGGDGDDSLYGGGGVDRLVESGDVDFTLTTSSLTGVGNDHLRSIEIAEIDGGSSDNVIDVSAFSGTTKGFTVLRGHGGDDFIIGSAGRDLISGGDGDDTLQGKAGRDRLLGGDGDDRLSGHTGNDFLKGGRGRDIIYGATTLPTLWWAEMATTRSSVAVEMTCSSAAPATTTPHPET